MSETELVKEIPDFKQLSNAVNDQWEIMTQSKLYIVDLDKDEIWDCYLSSFPDGYNPIFRERTYHDCSCCRNFVKNIGRVVSIDDGEIVSVWDVDGLDYPYDIVAQSLSDLVKSKAINSVFLTKERSFSVETNREIVDNVITSWNHLFAKVPDMHVCNDVGKRLGHYNGVYSVFRRGLEELSLSALETVLDLINDNNIYRGREHLEKVKSFLELKKQYTLLNSDTARNIYVWDNINELSARFKNEVIGTLVSDISSGEDIEIAVKKFESKVAPTNYKRPKAIITKKMVDDAMNTIQELGVEESLQRRYATIRDVSINDVLFADNSVSSQMKDSDSVQSKLMGKVKGATPNIEKATHIKIDDFMQNIIPKCNSIDLILKNNNLSNFMSLTAPANDTVKGIFQWGNDFAWSYDGEITDSGIKERVKRAGGKTDGKLRVSLAWFNYDDLDIHVIEPNGNRICYSNKSNKLDVDMNAGGKSSRQAVENVTWNNTILDGGYNIIVNNYQKREKVDHGFLIEIENEGNLQVFSYEDEVKNRENVQVGTMTLKNGKIIDMKLGKNITSDNSQVDKWGVKTNTPIAVETMMYSPNYWGDSNVGNKHWFFMLKGCKNPDSTRGIYNEFLNSDLAKHRRVFEVLGSETKCPYSDDQLSGVGFSSTKDDSLTLIAKYDNTQQVFNVTFN